MALYYWKKRKISWHFTRWVLIGFLGIACFFAWQDEYRRAQSLQEAKVGLEASLRDKDNRIEDFKARRDREEELQTQISALTRQVDQRAKRQAIREQLATLLSDGENLKNQCLKNTTVDPPISEANAWVNHVIRYLAQSGIDLSYGVRFRNPQASFSFSHGVPPAHENLWNQLNRRTSLLEKFIEELKD